MNAASAACRPASRAADCRRRGARRGTSPAARCFARGTGDQVREHIERRAIRPVQVVEHHHCSARPASRLTPGRSRAAAAPVHRAASPRPATSRAARPGNTSARVASSARASHPGGRRSPAQTARSRAEVHTGTPQHLGIIAQPSHTSRTSRVSPPRPHREPPPRTADRSRPSRRTPREAAARLPGRPARDPALPRLSPRTQCPPARSEPTRPDRLSAHRTRKPSRDGRSAGLANGCRTPPH